MADFQLALILKMAQTINPQIESDRKLEINSEKFRSLLAETPGREVARFLDDRSFEPIDFGDRIQGSSDILHGIAGLSPSGKDEIVLQAFSRDRVFRLPTRY
jgi:ubiquinone biosynthesis protein COQ4